MLTLTAEVHYYSA